MRTLRLTRLAWPLSATMLLLTTAQAMEIQNFDKMAEDDQAEYVADLIQGSEDVLHDAGKRDQAEKLRHLFADIATGDQISPGVAESNVNLAGVRAAEVSRQKRDPKLRHLEVEDAFNATAEDHGIQLPEAFKTVGAHFHPQHAPKDAVAGNSDAPHPPKSAAPAGASSKSVRKPMIVDNPDGTFTIQKEPPKDAKGDYKGLVIPPQVVVPFVRLPEKKQSPTPQQKNQ
jgi:hypothetical protein